jgi:formylglycine-generating enzyme
VTRGGWGARAVARAAVAAFAPLLVSIAIAVSAAPAPGAVASATDMVRVPGGIYRPMYRQPAGKAATERRVESVRVAAFRLQRSPVTNAQFLAFVREHPQWRRSRVSRLFADTGYLRHWRSDLELGPDAPAESPVVNVSWFAARAFCEGRGLRLPTVAEWELVAMADEHRRDATRDPRFLDRIRDVYERPTPRELPPVGHGWRNVYGLEDLHGLVWEWTLDFDSALVTGESRADGTVDRNLYCGGGASGFADFRDYAAFMRFAFRGSLEARYTTANLGFRAARDDAPALARKDVR